MPTITAETAQGTKTIDGAAGRRLVLILEDGGVDILHRCGGNARCTTCRVEITGGDLPEGASLEDIDQALLTEVLVDQVDLDGDKVGEVVTMTTSFEGATYKIYRRQKGQWASVYEFYSYRCAY